MKRIIEIPDKVVEAIQNGEDYRYDIHTTIAQSVPYNPTGDCISREALKKDFKERNIWNSEIVSAIDSAPTVKFSLLPADESKDEAYMRGYNHGKIEGILKANARPQGDLISREWLLERARYTNALECNMYVVPVSVIDNAPTVDIKDQIAGAYNEGYMCGNKEAEKARQQGEWSQYDFHDLGGLGDWDYKCSNCGKVNGGRSNFCPNCGADMRKGGAK